MNYIDEAEFLTLESLSILVSITVIVVSLWATLISKKVAEETSRPYISIYRKDIDVGSFIVIKNHGSSPAVIKDIGIITYPLFRDFLYDSKDRDPFAIKDLVLHQNEQVEFYIEREEDDNGKFVVKNKVNFVAFHVKYERLNGKKYSGDYFINFNQNNDIPRHKYFH